MAMNQLFNKFSIDREQLLADAIQNGSVRCECCNRLLKVYRRQIAGRTAADAIMLYRLGDGFHHISEFKSGTDGEFAKLRFWGLVNEQAKAVDDNTKRTSGFWSLTGRGKMWVNMKLAIPKCVILLDGELIGFDEHSILITESLGTKFDYGELMTNTNRSETNG
jgi:hypothetical protein